MRICLLGGLVFLLVFALAYSRIPPGLYTLRDDGIITTSHARNLVDYGFIGVSPSGPRVEGYSAPAQFLVYAVAYAATGVPYDTFASLQTIVSTFVLGALFLAFFVEEWRRGLVLTALGASFLATSMPFLEWHGSGMENAVTHVLFLGVALTLAQSMGRQRVTPLVVPIAALATVARTDSVYHVAPMLLVFSIAWRASFRSWAGLRSATLVGTLWMAYNVWRYLYFGDWLPNTAHAQNIVVGVGVADLLRGNFDAGGELSNAASAILTRHGASLFVFAAPLAILGTPHRRSTLLYALAASMAVTSWLSPYVFGVSRLDAVRPTTPLALFVALTVSEALYRLPWRGRSLASLGVMLPLGAWLHLGSVVPPSSLCCEIRGFDGVRRQFARIANDENLPRPTVANADLGVLSWHKQFNVVDLGMLGSPIIATIQRGPLLSDYFFDYAAPDIVESHPYWTCQYLSTIFAEPRFTERYEPVRVTLEDAPYPCAGSKVASGLWVRKDIRRGAPSRERELIDALSRGVSVGLVERALEVCQQDTDAHCAFVARSAYRFLPEFRRAGDIAALQNVFRSSRTRRFDRHLIEGYRDGRSFYEAIDEIAARHAP